MEKLAAYEMVLSEHPLWGKEAASSLVEAYQKGKPLLLKALNSRSPTELRRTGGAFKQHRLSGLGKDSPLGGSFKRRQFSKQFQHLHRQSRGQENVQRAEWHRKKYGPPLISIRDLIREGIIL